MTGSWWQDLLISLAVAIVLIWAALIVALLEVRPRGALLKEALRLLPDVLRLLRRLAADPQLPRSVRIRLALLMAYLAMPVDLVPDVIPVLGYSDDAIIVTAVLRSVVRRAGLHAVRRNGPAWTTASRSSAASPGYTTAPPSPERTATNRPPWLYALWEPSTGPRATRIRRPAAQPGVPPNGGCCER